MEKLAIATQFYSEDYHKIHCVKSVCIRSYSGPYLSHILSVFSPNAGKCGENAEQNNTEYGHAWIGGCNAEFSKTN